MEFTYAEIGFIVGMLIWCIATAVYLWVDSLKFKLRNMEYDRDMYRSLYELQKEYDEVRKKYSN